MPTGETGGTFSEWEIRSPQGRFPGGLCVFDLRTSGPGAGHATLRAELADRSWTTCADLELPPLAVVKRLLATPPEAERLVLQVRGPTTISRLRVHQPGTVLLILMLLRGWLARQARRPATLPAKLTGSLRVLLGQGPGAAREGLVISQMTSQASTVAAAPWTARTPVAALRRPRPRPSPRAHRVEEAKDGHDLRCRQALASFLASGERLSLPTTADPAVSIVVVTHNRAELTLACLKSIAAHTGREAQVVVIDNASGDDTAELLGRLDGVVTIGNRDNVGFLRACHQGVERCSGGDILFLNNDAELLPGSLDAARRALAATGAAAVGGRLVALDGRLQEAGGIVWGDGSCEGYGRGDDPDRPEYRFRRPVQFVSGAFLLTPRAVWDSIGGFDERFAPAYYEDVDYCLRAWQSGRPVVYEPGATVVHYEYGSSSPAAAVAAMRGNRQVLLQRHGDRLPVPDRCERLARLKARSHPSDRRRVLMIDDRVPVATAGRGAPRAAAIVRALVELDFDVTLYPLLPFAGSWTEVYDAVPRETEVMLSTGRGGLRRFLATRAGYYSHLFVSRTANVALVDRLRRRHPRLFAGTRVVYDVEALAAEREAALRKLQGVPLDTAVGHQSLVREIRPLTGAHGVSCVSERERRILLGRGVANPQILADGISVGPTARRFEDRSGLLFVGPLTDDWSPNVEGMRWFLDHVLPRLRHRLRPPPTVRVVGGGGTLSLSGRRWEGVEFLGVVDDLVALYDAARVFVAPIRFAAGLPHKVIEAAAHGLPVVTTDLLANQLGWDAGVELLSVAGDDADGFAQCCVRLLEDGDLWDSLRAAALARTERQCGYAALVDGLRSLL